MILFTSHITPRVCYIIEFVSKELFDDPAAIRITNDLTFFSQATGPRFNYSEETFHDCLYLRPNGLLFETSIQPVEITCITHNDQKAFFPTEGDLPFDIFAASFYLLSRYEEYSPIPKMNTAALPTPIHSHGKRAFWISPRSTSGCRT